MKSSTLFLILLAGVTAWSPQHVIDGSSSSRRFFLSTTTSTIVAGLTSITPFVANAADTGALLDELKDSKTKMDPIPELLEQQDWNKVRTILKTPPVNKLWNLGDSQNTVMKLAKETGDPELFELKDELATTIQICDQLTYDNVFVYYQPGNGKVNIKEPVKMAKQAIQQLQQIIDMAS